MSFFSKYKSNDNSFTQKEESQSQDYSSYITPDTEIDLGEWDKKYDLLGYINRMLSLIPKAQKIIPSFEASEHTSYLRIAKTYINKSKYEPYLDYVRIASENDVFHFWFYSSGALWKAECWFWPKKGTAYNFVIRRKHDSETQPLMFEEVKLHRSLEVLD